MRRLSRRALIAGAVGLTGTGAGVAGYRLSNGRDGGLHRFENEFLAVDLETASGAIAQVANKRRGLDLIDASYAGGAPPWRILLADGSALERPASFDLEPGPAGATMRWTSQRGHELRGEITLHEGEPSARFEIALEGRDAEALEYPVLRGIGALSGDDRLLHSHATGFLFRNPFELFEEEGDGPGRGLLWSPYPEGFSGSTLQLMAYYAAGRGGFSFAAEDPTGALKWLNFFKGSDGYLQAAVMHGSADVESGALRPSYPVLVGALDDGTWTEAADRYKTWAVRQPWCEQGPLEERQGRPRWLYEDVGLVVFGINASHDRSPWIEELGLTAGTTVLHILGPNWTPVEQDYLDNFPGGIADWFPARFAPENRAAIRRSDGRMAPFYFDLLFGIYHSEHEAGMAALQAIPSPTYSFDAYSFPFLCPVTRFLRELHRERNARLAGEYGVDAVYYDISASNVMKQCYDSGHGHPRGGGAFLVDAYRELYQDSGEAMAQAAGGRYVPQGSELVNEIFVDRLDFYQARAEASPASPLEADQFRDWVENGRTEKVPLFTYVYHEYGPVRTDGWGKLSSEQGELFYWIAARVLTWGGIYQLNYEFSPLEVLDGRAEPLDEHYFPLPDHRYAIDPDKAAFVAEVAAARTGFAGPYLAYGTMLPALPVEGPSVELDWYVYNSHPNWAAYEQRGTRTVEAVVHGAWRRGEQAGVVLVNVDRGEHAVSVPLSRAALRLEGGGRLVAELVTREGRRSLGSFRTSTDLSVSLPSRKVVLVEVKSA
jgi:hypothetical protein